MTFYHPLFHPDPDPGAGDVPPPPGKETPLAVPIKVGETEYDQAAVETLVREKRELEEYRKHGRRLMMSDGSFDEKREESTRALMSDAGFEPDVIETYVEAQKNPPDPDPGSEEDPMGLEDDSVDDPPARPKGAKKDPKDELIERLTGRVDELEASVTSGAADRVQERLTSSVQAALDGNTDLGTLLKKANSIHGEDDADKRRAQFLQDVKAETTRNLSQRAARGGVYQRSWLEEESTKAAQQVADRFRSVIGDPASLGRAPETVSGQDSLVPTKPPDPPKFEPGDDSSDARTKAKDYTENALLSMASEISTEGESKA